MNNILVDLERAKYDAIDAVNISSLKELVRSPLAYQHRLRTRKETRAMRLGTAAHTAVLEPARFIEDYTVWDQRTASGRLRPRNGKDWEAFVSANTGKVILTETDYLHAINIRNAVRGNENAMRYLEIGDPEVTLTWVLDGVARKGRADWLSIIDGEPVIVGLKTGRDCRPIPFGNDSARMGYHLQWAWYFDGYYAITGVAPRMIEIMVESAPPHDVAVYRIPDEVLDVGRDTYQGLLEKLKECQEAKAWPGAVEGESILSMPTWIYRGEGDNDLSDLGLTKGDEDGSE